MMCKRARSQRLTTMSAEYLNGTLGRVKTAVAGGDIVRLAVDPRRSWFLDDWAVSAYERYGLNENHDGFEDAELKRSFGSFVGSWVCLDHDNNHISKSVGTNLDAVYTPEQYVRVAMAVDRQLSEARHPGLEQKVLDGVITDSSMGAICRESVCVACGNVAVDESQFCLHVLPDSLHCTCQDEYERDENCPLFTMKCNRNIAPKLGSYHRPGATVRIGGLRGTPVEGRRHQNGSLLVHGELNRGVTFFENSIITTAEGADNNAKFLNVWSTNSMKTAVSHAMEVARAGRVSIDAEKLYHVLHAMTVTASLHEKAILMKIVEQVETCLD